MRVAVFGSGGVGCYYGGRLQQSGAAEVTFVARGAQLRALREGGLELRSPLGDAQLRPVRAVERAAEAGPADWVLCGVKAWQVEGAADELRPLIGPETAVLPLQNGVEAADVLAGRLGSEHVVYGATWIAAHVERPGLAIHDGVEPRIAMGERDGRPRPRLLALRDALARSGVTVELPADMPAVLWRKLLLIASVSGLSAVTRLPIPEWRGLAQTRRQLESALEEIAAVARARGVALPADVVAATLAFIDGLPAGTLPSMARDILEGRPSELHAQNGAVVRLGAQAGVPTPTHDWLFAALLPQELRARKAS